MEKVRLDNKVAIVTGANTGIGKETAKQLARRGCKVIMACRDEQRALAALDEIQHDPDITEEQLVFMELDLGSLQSVRKFAEKFKSEYDRLDLLVNNAGVIMQDRGETIDGFEIHMGVNHLGHFLLTNLLLEKLKQSAPSRVINVSADLYKIGKIDFEDLQFKNNWMSIKAYGRSKTANILFTVSLAKRLEGTGVTTYSLHPGVIHTEILRHGKGFIKCYQFFCLRGCCRCLVKNTEQGARTTLYCCLEPRLAKESGLYYRGSRQKSVSSFASDPVLAEKLWSISEDLTGITSP